MSDDKLPERLMKLAELLNSYNANSSAADLRRAADKLERLAETASHSENMRRIAGRNLNDKAEESYRRFCEIERLRDAISKHCDYLISIGYHHKAESFRSVLAVPTYAESPPTKEPPS